MPKQKAIPCSLLAEVKERIEVYADQLREAGHSIGEHGLSPEEFSQSGLFPAAIERLRGQQAATMRVKHAFLQDVLGHLKNQKLITDFAFTGQSDRFDYEISMPNGRKVIFEAKGCLDGNNTNIFQRPANADEFVIWSLCQNSGADPEKNAWSGIHTRLGPTIVAEKQRVDGLIIWDMVCGTIGRPCPKLALAPKRSTLLPSGRNVPPPCIYLFPRTVPDPRDNPSPPAHTLNEVSFLEVLAKAFKCDASDVNTVEIAARMNGADVERKTVLKRGGVVSRESEWNNLKRAR